MDTFPTSPLPIILRILKSSGPTRSGSCSETYTMSNSTNRGHRENVARTHTSSKLGSRTAEADMIAEISSLVGDREEWREYPSRRSYRALFPDSTPALCHQHPQEQAEDEKSKKAARTPRPSFMKVPLKTIYRSEHPHFAENRKGGQVRKAMPLQTFESVHLGG